MLDDDALAVSLPATEIAATRLPGSVFRDADLHGLRFSAPLARALNVLRASASYAGVELVFVARPEILAHGESLAWLQAKMGPVRRHLALSDGATVKTIPGLENYVFFYDLGRRANAEALATLQRRAPELFSRLEGQVNTGLSFGAATPVPIVLEGAARRGEPVAFFPAACDVGSLEDGLLRTLRAGPRSRLDRRFRELTYVPLTETSLGDPRFVRWLAEEAGHSYFGRPRALVVRLPENIGASFEIEDRLHAALSALQAGGARMPIAPAEGVWFAVGDPSAVDLLQAAAAVAFVAPASYDFWRAPPAAYRGFRSLVVHAPESDGVSDSYEGVVEALTGIAPRFASDDPADGSAA